MFQLGMISHALIRRWNIGTTKKCTLQKSASWIWFMDSEIYELHHQLFSTLTKRGVITC